MLYINGEWIQGENTLKVVNPSTGEVIDEVTKCNKDEIEHTIEAAESAFKEWSKTTAKERGAYLLEVGRILRDRTEEIAQVITKEMGKPLNEAKTEISLAIDYLEWYAEEAKRIYGETIPPSSGSKRLTVIRQPIGVVGAITPWNFPIAMITRKVAPALASGCTAIIKPASATPLTAIEVVKACHEAGIPKGVVNLLHGSASEISKGLMDSPIVRKITFTGSTEVGKQLVRDSAKTLKKLAMELGGHAPFIVFEDADLDQAVEGLMASKFRNAGQTCVCTNRVYVHENVIDSFAQKLKEKVDAMKIGDGFEENVDIGPLIDGAAVEKSLEHVEDAVQKGAKVITGGKKVTEEPYHNGSFMSPTVIVNATHEMKISHEETFGPIAPLFPFNDEEEVVELANSSEYGLASYIYTNDISRSVRVSEALQYGIVGINDALPTVAQAPFGGIKESGFGREGGRQGIEDYLEYKFLSLQINSNN